MITPIRLYAAAIFTLLLVAGGWYVGHLGPALKDARATVKAQAQNQQQEVTDANTINAEVAKLAASALDPIVAPVVRVQYAAPACLPAAAAPAGRGDGGPDLRAPAAPHPVPGPDIGGPSVRVGKTCDAQVSALQDYVLKVCRAPH